jgi:hypothetical protein
MHQLNRRRRQIAQLGARRVQPLAQGIGIQFQQRAISPARSTIITALRLSGCQASGATRLVLPRAAPNMPETCTSGFICGTSISVASLRLLRWL